MADKTYKVQAPDGSVIEFSGPEDASSEQIREAAKRAYAARSSTAAEPPAPQVQQQPAAAPQEPLTFGYNAGKALEYIPAGVMDVVGRGEVHNLGRGLAYLRNALVSPSFQRTAPPIVSAMLFPPSTLAAAGAAYPTLASAITNFSFGMMGSQLAGDNNAESIKNAIYSAYPGTGRAKEASGFFRAAAKESGKEIAGLTAMATGAELAARSIEAGRPTGFDSWNDFIYTVGPIAAMGVVAGGAKGYGANAGFYARELQRARDDFTAFAGLSEVPLGVISPDKYATIEARIAKNNPELAKRITNFGNNIAERYQALFGDVMHPADVAQGLNQYAGKLTAERNTLERLQSAAQKADEELVAARNAGIAPEELEKISKAALESRAALINQRAATRFWEDAGIQSAGVLKSLPKATKEFASDVAEIFAIRRKQANIAYKESGVNMNERVLSANELADAAARALRNRKTPQAEAIIQRIRQAGGEDGTMSINEARELRTSLSDLFTDGDWRAQSNAESLAATAYGAVSDKVNQAVRNRYGEEVYSKFSDVNRWYARTSNAMNSAYVQRLIKEEPGVSMIESIAREVADGKFESYDGFKNMVREIARMAPDVAEYGYGALNKAIRAGFLRNAASGTSAIDLMKLSKSLDNAASRDFPVSELGFGTRQQIRNVAKAFEQYRNAGKLTAEDMNEFFSNPIVREELARGGNMRAVSRKYAAESAFKAMVKEDILRAQAGAKPANTASALVKKQYAARAAGLDAAQQAKIVREMEKDPLMVAFGRDVAGMPKAFDTGPNAILNQFAKMAPGNVSEVMTAMRRSRPDLAHAVSQRITADALGAVLEGSGEIGSTIWRVNPDKARRILTPAIEGDMASTAHLLRAVMEPKKYDHFKRALPAFNRINDYYQRTGAIPFSEDIKTLLGISTAMALNRPGAAAGQSSLWGKVMNFMQARKYNFVSRLLSDVDFAEGFGQYMTGGSAAARGANDAVIQRFLIQVAADPELKVEAAGEIPGF